MNIFNKIEKELIDIVSEKKKELKLIQLNNFKGITVESPPQEFDFDLSSNIALILGKTNGIKPFELASNIKKLVILKSKNIETIEVAGPGFLNIKLTSQFIYQYILDIIKFDKNYGSSINDKSFNIEFVSANPTGPMHVGHCRGAIYGDVLSNLLKFNGNKVTKEYYINDYGNQIINFAKSVFLRIREIKYQEKFPADSDLYPGQYILDIAEEIINSHPKLSFSDFKKDYELLAEESLKYSMKLIKSDLKKLGIQHDYFFSEKEIVKKDLVNKAIKILEKNDYIKEGYLDPPKGDDTKNWIKKKRLLFKSKLFGDDTDRALQKNDGTWTYFANDVAYHLDKVSRGYDFLINILGADHTGYIKRISGAVSALSQNKIKLECRVCQLVKLYKKGKPFKMSKRAGDFISAQDLLKEVDKDSIRFMMLNRSNDMELDFDFDKVLEKNKENPVFYVQYCYARINSLFNTLKINLKDPLIYNGKDFNLNSYEIRIIRKIFNWPKVIETASKKFEPHRIPFYLYDLATLFHSYWSKGNEDENYRFINNGVIRNTKTLFIIKSLSIVIENGMNILGVSLPKKM
ncbi:MAG: arginine--tRNA ligase [Pelagibacteraceae bacterium]